MKIKYKNKKIEEICTNIKKATLHFGGDKNMAISLFSRINALQQSETIMDIILQPQMRFHKLTNKGKNNNFEGYFAIYVKTKRDKWRLIIEPLDDNEEKFIPCNIDLIAKIVKIIEIKEVSNHYE